MKRFLRYLCLIVAVCIALTLCGCGNDKTDSDTEYTDWEYESGATVNSNEDGTEVVNDNTDSGMDNDSAAKSGESKVESSTTNKGGYDPYAGIEKYKGKTVNMFTWWKLKDQEKQVVKDFIKKYGIKVELQYSGYEEYTTKITAAISSGKGPDVVALEQRNFLNLINSGMVQPLPSGVINLEKDTKLDKAAMSALMWNNKYYGINIANNMTYSTYVMYYNKSMFDSQGVTDPGKLWKSGKWNWDTFTEAAKKMTRRVNNKTIYGVTSLETSYHGLILSTGTDFTVIDGKKNKIKNNILNSKVVSAFCLVSELREGGYWNPDSDTASFAKGEAAMLLGHTWMFETSSMPKLTDKWSAVPVPSPKGTKETIGVEPTIWGLANGAKNKEAALYFLRYWLDEDNSDLKKCIVKDDLRELFVYLTNQKRNRNMSGSRCVVSYFDESRYWSLMYAAHRGVNDVPIELKKWSPNLDEIISKILKQ